MYVGLSPSGQIIILEINIKITFQKLNFKYG